MHVQLCMKFTGMWEPTDIVGCFLFYFTICVVAIELEYFVFSHMIDCQMTQNNMYNKYYTQIQLIMQRHAGSKPLYFFSFNLYSSIIFTCHTNLSLLVFFLSDHLLLTAFFPQPFVMSIHSSGMFAYRNTNLDN